MPIYRHPAPTILGRTVTDTRENPLLSALAAFADPQPWADQALCAQTDPESFFPENGGSPHEAKKVCLSCEVRVECLDYALSHGERFGVWGGVTERERRKMRKAAA